MRKMIPRTKRKMEPPFSSTPNRTGFHWWPQGTLRRKPLSVVNREPFPRILHRPMRVVCVEVDAFSHVGSFIKLTHLPGDDVACGILLAAEDTVNVIGADERDIIGAGFEFGLALVAKCLVDNIGPCRVRPV